MYILFVLGTKAHNAYVLQFYVCTFSEQLSMSYMEKRYRNEIISSLQLLCKNYYVIMTNLHPFLIPVGSNDNQTEKKAGNEKDR